MNRVVYFFICCLPSLLIGQELDSLKHLLQSAPQKQHAFLHGEIGYAYEKTGQLDLAHQWYRKGALIGGEQEQADFQGRNLRYRGMLFSQQAEYDSAALFLQQAIGFFMPDSLSFDRAKAMVDLGNVYYHTGKLERAAEIYMESAKLYDDMNMGLQAGVVYGNLGALHMELNNFERAIEFHELNYKRSKEVGALRHLGRAYYNIGSCSDALEDFDKAIAYYDSALVMAEDQHDTALMGYCYMGKSSLAGKLKQYPDAIKFARKALSYASQLPDSLNSINRMARFMAFNGDYAEARKYFQLSQDLANEHGMSTYVLEVLDFWQLSAAEAGAYKEAYKYLDQFRYMSDSILSSDLESKVYELEIKYESARKEQENLRLRAENSEQQLEIDQTKSRIRIRTLGLLLVIVLLILAIVAFLYYRKTSLQQRRIVEQEAERLRQGQRILTAEAMVEGQEAERTRLSQELHDGLGGLLATARNLLEAEAPANQSQGLELLKEASNELRRMAYALMPGSLARFGLQSALNDLITSTQETTPAEIEFQLFGIDEQQLSEEVQKAIFRVIQELLHNLQKHAEAKEVFVQLIQKESQLDISYEDDGKGIDLAKVKKGVGMNSMQRRIAYLGGHMELQSKPGEGFSVYIQIPLSDQTKG
ncbi:MAG: tetratricopeptide repeat protein [Bacteroidota bacterium]